MKTIYASSKEYDKIIKEMDSVFEQVDKVFKEMDIKMDEVQQESWESVNSRQKWEPYISWVPRKIGKRWYWHSPIYRKYQFNSGNGFWKYGTEFDVLKESK
jgi:hypothetical protein